MKVLRKEMLLQIKTDTLKNKTDLARIRSRSPVALKDREFC